jgi:peptidoglycan/xylan/chitin deacetylase (PgdA/CDA1 family)
MNVRFQGAQFSLFFVCLIATLLASSSEAAEKAFVWPHGARAAVSLAYDDALDSQLDNAIPALNKYGFKASFYLTLSSPTIRKRLVDWRQLASNGHELGNHSLFHQCSRKGVGRDWVREENDLDHLSVAQLVAQIRLGNSMLFSIDGKSERSFTVPCGDALAAGVDYLSKLKEDFIAIKFGVGGVVENMLTLDPYAVSVAVPSDVTGAQLIEIVQRAAARGSMANITFHGVGSEHLSVSTVAHETLLAYLATHRDIYWTDTFLTIMSYVKAHSKTMRH